MAQRRKILTFLLFTIISISIASAQNISITPLTQDVQSGQQFYIGVNINSFNDTVQFAHVEVDFPAANMTALTITYNNLMGGYVAVEPGSGIQNGKIIYGISLTSGNATAVSGTFITIGMVPTNTANGTSLINLSNVDIMNTTVNHLTASDFNLTNGSVNISYFTSSSSSTIFQQPPHDVAFVVQDLAFDKKAGVNVTAQGFSTTVGSWNWLTSLIGINFVGAPINTAVMNGTTGTDGSIDFKMDASIYYEVQFSGGGISNMTWRGYPTQYQYLIIVQTTYTGAFNNGVSETNTINTNVSTLSLNANTANIFANYSDSLNQTTSLLIYLNQSIPGDPNNQTTIQTLNGGTNSSYNGTFVITPYSGTNYIINFRFVHTSFGTVQRSYGVSFPPATPLINFNPVSVLMLIVGFIFFIAGFWGQTSTEQGSGVIVGFVWILSSIGLFANLNLGLSFYLGLTLATVITILMNINARSRREGMS